MPCSLSTDVVGPDAEATTRVCFSWGASFGITDSASSVEAVVP